MEFEKRPKNLEKSWILKKKSTWKNHGILLVIWNFVNQIFRTLRTYLLIQYNRKPVT